MSEAFDVQPTVQYTQQINQVNTFENQMFQNRNILAGRTHESIGEEQSWMWNSCSLALRLRTALCWGCPPNFVVISRLVVDKGRSYLVHARLASRIGAGDGRIVMCSVAVHVSLLGLMSHHPRDNLYQT